MGFSDSGIQGYYDNGLELKGLWDGRAGRLYGGALKEALSGGIDHLLNALVITDDDVEAQNRVSLSAFPADANGPVAKVEFHHRNRSARTKANREFMANAAAKLLRGAGATKVYRMNWPPLILHVQSTMRMGRSELDSVLDSTGEARWVKHLFSCDNSALSNSLGGANPTLTSQALATRTSEHIYSTYFGGEPWVGIETPVSSIDDRVTRAVLSRGL